MQLQSEDESHFNERDYRGVRTGQGEVLQVSKKWWKYAHIFTLIGCHHQPAIVSSFCTIIPSWMEKWLQRASLCHIHDAGPGGLLSGSSSALFSPHPQRFAGRRGSLFRLWVARFSHRPLPSPSMPWHCLQRETHACVNVRACTHTILEDLTASPITLASWFVY